MYSSREFMPGGHNKTSRMIHYTTIYNHLYPNKTQLNCYCILGKYDKNTPTLDSSSLKVSYARRMSQIIQSKRGGSTQIGNFYLGQPVNVNYLGRVEGMPGGSGAPPVNRFN